MASRSTFKITGDKELKRTLFQMGQAAADILEGAATKAAEVVREGAERRAPRDSGTLASNIFAEINEKSRTKVTISVGPGKEAFYGIWVELGTAKTAPHPYLRPAADQEKDNAFATYSVEIKRALDEVK